MAEPAPAATLAATVAAQLPIDFPDQALTRRELLSHLAAQGYRTGHEIVSELQQRNYATEEDVRKTFTTMFDSAKEEFDDQRKQIRLLLDRTNVMNNEFGDKAKEATEKIDEALITLKKHQQEVVDHLQAQAMDNGHRDS